MLIDRIGNEITKNCIVEHDNYFPYGGNGSVGTYKLKVIEITPTYIRLEDPATKRTYQDSIPPSLVISYLRVIENTTSKINKHEFVA